jgi:hypothetical protein
VVATSLTPTFSTGWEILGSSYPASCIDRS